jgi:hypothetical protein
MNNLVVYFMFFFDLFGDSIRCHESFNDPPSLTPWFINKSLHVTLHFPSGHALRHVGFGAVPSFPNLLHAPGGMWRDVEPSSFLK